MADDPHGDDNMIGTQPQDQEPGDHDDLFGDIDGDQNIETQDQNTAPPETSLTTEDTSTVDPHEQIIPSIEGLPDHRHNLPEEIDEDMLMNEAQDITQSLEDATAGISEDLQEEVDVTNDGQDEQQEHGEVMADIQNEQQMQDEVLDSVPPEPEEHNDTSIMQPRVQGQEREGSSLFVPEQSPSVPPTPRASSAMPPPPFRPSAGPSSRPASRPPLSTFAKIRNLQKRLQQNKVAASRPQHSHQPNLDNEAYLEAIQPSGSGPRLPGTDVGTLDHDDKIDRQAAAEYQKQKLHYKRLKQKNGGHLTFRQDVEWMKIHAEEKRRQDKRKRDLQKDRADEGELDLFPEVHGPSTSREDDNSDEDSMDLDPSSSRKRRRLEMPRKEPKPISIQDAELQSMRVALEAARDKPGKKRWGHTGSDDSPASRSRTRPKGSKSKAATLSSNISTKTSSKRGRKSAKDKAAEAQATRQATSLFTADVFQDQAAEDAPEQPVFQSKNKQLALKELIMSVPLDDKKVASSDMSSLILASREFDGRGAAKIGDNGMWKIRGMKTSLKGYQLLGSAFMRRRERAEEEPHGGLMADQMGLGKTLMMLANIVNGHPGKGAKCKTTLLVASPALLTQWSREIDLHVGMDLKIMRYGAGNRIDSNASFEVLELHDIILTTYSEIMRSYPKNDPPKQCQTAQEKMDWWKRQWEMGRGVLHRMMFYRVVLDEAQAIKNHLGRTSIACRALMARKRWALSGTPILNGLTELYPYFRFLNVPHTGSFKIFKQNYCTPGEESNERLLIRLSSFMIRRTHADKMFNAPILKLPKADQLLHFEHFNAVERNIYDIVEQRYIETINTWSRNGELDKAYSNILVMLLRLRQLTAHPLMLQLVIKDLLEHEDIERIREVVKVAAADSSSVRGRTIIAIRRQLEAHAAGEKKKSAKKAAENGIRNDEDDTVDEEEDSDDDDEGSEVEIDRAPTDERMSSGKAFGKSYNFKPYLNSLTTGKSWQKAKKKAKCAFGNHRPKHPMLTSCGHLMCEACYEDEICKAAERGTDQVICGVCKKLFERAHMLENDQDDVENIDAPETRAMRKRRDKARKLIEQEDIATDWLTFDGDSVLPSAKTIAIKAQIMNWVKEDKDVKIIIYSQFLPMLRILAKICQEEGWPTEQYHGKLSYKARDEAITTFADNPNIRILLASLRCGGLGLNLTMASRVVIIDPWWNSAAEQQAFCRVFRFGQTEKTFLTRFCIHNSVDERLINMQKRKQKEIDAIMEDGGKTVKKMGLRDLMRLFGNLDEDEGGNPFILVDNPDPRGGFVADRDDEGYADDF